MSTYNAVRERIAVPPVSDLVDSIAKSASTAFDNFERNAANSKRAEQTPQVAEAPLAQHWMQTMPTPTSRLGKSGTFALVVLVHALVFAVLGYLTPKLKDERATPLQVVSIEAPQSDTHTPPPPPVPVLVQHFPDVNLPIEPVIDIYVDDSTSITVTPRPTEPAATTDVGTPKIVSSVEYVREPVAKYPPAARTLKQRGTVTLRALIDASGHASEVNVHRSSGYRLLDDTARTAVLNALFKPYMENGQFIPVYVFIPIEFGTAG